MKVFSPIYRRKRDPHGKWDKSKGKSGKHKEEVPSAKEEVNQDYEEYLMLLQQRNRLLRKLKEKDDQQIKLEKKEQGFSIYVNGANVELGRAQTRAKSRSSSRHSKTAGDAYHERKRLLQHELENLEREAGISETRIKTAPDDGPTFRKGWKYDSIQIKTDEGKRLKIRAPGKLTGNYSEDFESVAVDGSDSEEDNDQLLRLGADIGDDLDISSGQEELNFDNDDDDDVEEDETDELALSFKFNDVETLRKSLEADETIRESIEAAHKRLQRETKGGKAVESDNDDDDDDEVEEELEAANDSLNLQDAAVLGRLPQLTSTPDESRREISSPVRHSQDRSKTAAGSGRRENSQPGVVEESGRSVAADKEHVQGKKQKDRGSKQQNTSSLPTNNKPIPENRGEDLVVLSFSSPSVKRKERVLSATRRKQDIDDHDTSQVFLPKPKTDVKVQEPKRFNSDGSQEKEFTLTSAHEKKSRPLSATRRSKPAEKLDNNAEEIFRAMAEENQTIAETKMSGCQTAPERSKNYSPSPLPEVTRPSSIASVPLKTEETIALVTEKVRKMDPRQQCYLIDMLAKLEYKTPAFKAQSPTPSPRQSPMKATLPFTPVTRSTAADDLPEPLSARDSLDTNEDFQSNNEGTDVYFEILSNWGNSEHLGLTEIQFFDLEGNLIPSDGQHVSISGHVGEDGALGNLVNGKTKTTKGRYMWSCRYQARRPVELVFHLPCAGATDSESHGLSKICVWNYNRGIKELNVGVKDVRIFVGGELVWEGVIDKGCGNQVFDYCKVIDLMQTDTEDLKQVPEPVIRSQTVVLRRSSDVKKQEQAAHSEAEALGSQSVKQPQEKQRHPSVRSETVLLGQSTEKEAQRSKEEVEKENSGAVSNDSRIRVVESTQSKENHKFPRPPESPRSHTKSPRMQRRGTGGRTEGSHSKDKDTRHSAEQDSRLQVNEETLQSLLASDGSFSHTGLEPILGARSSSTPNLPSSEACESQDPMSGSVRGNSAAGSVLPSRPPWLEKGKNKDKDGLTSRSSSRSKSRPIWFENDAGDPSVVGHGRSSSLTDVRDSSEQLRNDKPRSRPSSGRRSSTPGGNGAQACSSELSNKDVALPTCLDNAASQQEERSRSGSGNRRENTQERNESNTTVKDSSPPHNALSARTKWRGQQNMSLEESWSLLTLFEKSHRGRITKDLDLKNHDDALDQLLSNRREEGNLEAIREPIKETEERLIDLEIPTLPKGRQLVINLRNTWGDRHYVGLNGIEIFTDSGKPAEIAEITANPQDINILPEYGNDPRVVTNLIDGVYRTRDDMHLWLAPFTAGGTHTITITFLETLRIAMIRIWNYNKSRIHSFRGVRCIDITLDGCLIFQGEIARASGILGADDSFGDTILFTMDEEILESMAQFDQTYEVDEEDEDELMRSCYFERPSTADLGEGGGNEDRPFTSARQHVKKSKQTVVEESADDVGSSTNNYLVGKVLQLNFVSTWGDPYYLGLTGLELLGTNLEAVPLSFNMMKACPRDLNDLPGYGDDDRTLDKVIDGTNVTMSDEHMWMIPFTDGQDHILTIDLGQNTPLVGLRIWNYNKSTDDSFRGAKQVHVKLDDRNISPAEGFLLRKGPGTVHFDHGQDIYFIKPTKEKPTDSTSEKDAENRRVESRVNIKKLMPDYEPTLMPCGFVFQFQLFSTWGDPYYIGLNGLQFYDENGYIIRLSKNNVTAHPHSVNVLEGVTDDIRTPDKLVDGVNDTNDGRHMWLAPIIPGMINLIYVVFDEPVTVSMVKVWNYSKTPIRGVQQFGLLVDDLLVYHGILPQVPAVTRGILPNLDMPTPHHTILFTDQEQIALAERKNVLSNKGGEQDIQLTNDKRIVSHFSDPKSAGKAADPALRPMTSVPASQKKR